MKKYFELGMSILIMELVIFIDVYIYNNVESSIGKNLFIIYISFAGMLISYIYYLIYETKDK